MTSVIQGIVPVLLAGGSGTRLWPLSRKSFPKQFSTLVGEKTLFQQSALRLNSSSSVSFGAPITLTNTDFRFIVAEQLQSVGIDPGAILIEPAGKNTAPAILAASLYAMKQDADAILLVAPSDHVVPDTTAFHKVISDGLKAVNSGKIVTFGISPTRAETGYGYLEVDVGDAATAQTVKRFIEKPDEAAALKLLDAGSYLWNAGIFMFRAHDMVSAFSDYAPELVRPVTDSLDKGKTDLGFFRLDADSWSKCKDVSIDY
ncbi:MAG: mannose-1-phosphate guanylyltransferase, partial [Candidatus Puniceispirillaceae bacterium]